VPDRTIGIGIIGAGLMGRELASAVARWVHLGAPAVRPEVVHVCDVAAPVLAWYERLEPRPALTTDHHALLADPRVEAVYCAVPHHLHASVYLDVLRAGKHLLAEKPFGIDLPAARTIAAEAAARPAQLVRVSSEFPFSAGGQEVWRWIAEGRSGRVVEVRAQLLHSSDLDPLKPINWKRQARFNGAYGCMGDLGMHALHLPLRAGWRPRSVRAVLSDLVPERPDGRGGTAPCDTWDNAALSCVAEHHGEPFPLQIATKRIAPGETNTWSIEIDGMEGSVAYSTKRPKTLRRLEYRRGEPQAWSELDLGSRAAYPTITGPIFETGFSDWLQQMLAAFLDELANGREGMHQPFTCATPEEALATHELFTAALASQAAGSVVELPAAAGAEVRA
jgi:predicted dehydrogenase